MEWVVVILSLGFMYACAFWPVRVVLVVCVYLIGFVMLVAPLWYSRVFPESEE